jgi:hypothetical protein
MLTLHFAVTHRVANGREQRRSVKRLTEKSADTLGAVLVGYLMAPRDQEHWKLWMLPLDKITKLEAVHTRHANVGNDHVYIR